MTEVRRATAEDVPALAATLTRAFLDDPVALYLFPDRAKRPGYLDSFFRLQLVRTYLPKGEVYLADDHKAGAMWMPPDVPQPGLGDQWAYVSMTLRTHSLRRGRRLALLLYRARPKERHYYLGTVGTEPDCQRRGVGSAVLRPVLARLDETGVPAYLESSREENNRFYEAHGFSLVGTTRVPGGPPLWLMWREPLDPP